MVDYPHRIRDPIHGFIHFADTEIKIIALPAFQRLRYIRQLALTSYVYPGATHTRFEHSLGVMELATRVFDILMRKYNRSIIKNFKAINLKPDQARMVLRLAALLHDIGHLPFSHGAEIILPKGKNHEDVSIAVIKSLKNQIDDLYFSGSTDIVVQLIEKGHILPELQFLKDILSGPIDADRMDYLLRDSHHCGVSYGVFDYHRLIETLRAEYSPVDGIELTVDHGGVHSIEALILARYYMYTQVCFHRTRRIYDHYLQKYMKHWAPSLDPLTNVLKYDDVSLLTSLRDCTPDSSGYEYARRICRRVHHSVVYETPEHTDASSRKQATIIHEALKAHFEDCDFVLDEAKGSIHKFFVPGDQKEGEELYVIHKTRRDLISNESHIIRTIPRTFHLIRIYASTQHPSQLDLIRKKAKALKKEVK